MGLLVEPWADIPMRAYKRSGKWYVACLLEDGTAATVAEIFYTKQEAEGRISELKGEDIAKRLSLELLGAMFDTDIDDTLLLTFEKVQDASHFNVSINGEPISSGFVFGCCVDQLKLAVNVVRSLSQTKDNS